MGATAGELSADLQRVCPEFLLRGGPRLDCVAMVLFRHLWRASARGANAAMPNLLLFADASPQRRGLELKASSFDMFYGTTFMHRLFPLVSLDKAFLDASGICLALLWHIFLLSAPPPPFILFRLFCSRVRSLTTEQGTERLLADCPHALPASDGTIDPQDKVQDGTTSGWRFPRTIAMPGRMRLWDLVLRRRSSGLKISPQWLVRLTAAVAAAFLRTSTRSRHRSQLARQGLARRGGPRGDSELTKLRRLSHVARPPAASCSLWPTTSTLLTDTGPSRSVGDAFCLAILVVAPVFPLRLVVLQVVRRVDSMGARVPLPPRGVAARPRCDMPLGWPADEPSLSACDDKVLH